LHAAGGIRKIEKIKKDRETRENCVTGGTSMNRTIILSAISVALLGSATLPAQAQQPPAGPEPIISFFVAENSKQTGNLGGLAGADAICQREAQALGGSNAARTWRAYLSQQEQGNTPRVNARDRIGTGPWFNTKGVQIADNVTDLHADQQGGRNNMRRVNMLDVYGKQLPGGGRPGAQNELDILTGSDPQGRAFTTDFDYTCDNWTSDADQAGAMLGHTDRNRGGDVPWNSTHISQGCSKPALNATGGTGRFYCFAAETISVTREASRLFAGPNQFPPRNYAAYGILAFPSRATSNDRDRYKMFCEAYVAVLPLAWELSVPDSQQMVTVWPMTSDGGAAGLNRARGTDVCEQAISNYDLVAATRAVYDARQAKAEVDGRGPYLLAWSPSTRKGQQDALVLRADLSNVTTADQAKDRFLRWKKNILDKPELWKSGWNVEGLRIAMMEWLDQYGPKVLELFGTKKND
jgi:hypothetical protein